MQTKTPSTIRRFGIAVAAIVTLSLFSAGIAVAGTMSGIDGLAVYVSDGTMLGTDGDEFSGATYNETRGVLLVVDDGGLAYEFDVEGNGAIDFGTPARRIVLQTGGDPEGVAWIGDANSPDRYAILHEDTGHVAIASIPTGPNPVVDQSLVEETFMVVPAGYVDDNTGPEGLSTDGAYWYVTEEKPAKVSRFTTDGTLAGEVDLSGDLLDASGVAVAEGDSLLVLSHESRVVNHYVVDWDTSTPTLIGTLDISDFSQAEGIATIGNNHLHVFGEFKGGTTYTQFNGTIATITSNVVGDADCSGKRGLLDAAIIARVSIGTAQHNENCGAADVDSNGNVDLIDARMIAQCAIDVANALCPQAGA